jgi:hypothetical protein
MTYYNEVDVVLGGSTGDSLGGVSRDDLQVNRYPSFARQSPRFVLYPPEVPMLEPLLIFDFTYRGGVRWQALLHRQHVDLRVT